MTLAKDFRPKTQAISIQPDKLNHILGSQQNYCLFLDIDGTLADFTLDPKDSVIAKETLDLLQKIQQQEVHIAAVTGRSLIEARQMLFPIKLPIAATHGLEIAFDGSQSMMIDNQTAAFSRSNELTAIKGALRSACLPYPKLRIEDKPYSVALHFRENPNLADTAYQIMTAISHEHPNWELKQGKYVWELLPKGVNKGTAILTLFEKMPRYHKLCPIFIGDDVTDEAGFLAVQGERLTVDGVIEKHSTVTGIGIKVGDAPTTAHYYLQDIADVTEFLKSFLTFCQSRSQKPIFSFAKNTTQKIKGSAI